MHCHNHVTICLKHTLEYCRVCDTVYCTVCKKEWTHRDAWIGYPIERQQERPYEITWETPKAEGTCSHASQPGGYTTRGGVG